LKTVLITSGDSAGIGPEICAAALRDRRVRAICRPVLLGDARAFKRAGVQDSVPLLDTAGLHPVPPYGKPSAAGGESSFRAVRLAVRLALEGKADALVTAPVCKESWALAKTGYKDHTSFLRESCKTADAAMMFVAGKVRCALVAEHFSMRTMPDIITREMIVSRAGKFCAALKMLGVTRPHIGVCALNPHAGDGGVLGAEEEKIIIPAIRTLNRQGIKAEGPLPSDAAWQRHAGGEFDGLLCMYHDQALAPLKLAAKTPVVHWTFGLPFIRVSPAHGTAFDIAGKNKADPSAMTEAILFAAGHSI